LNWIFKILLITLLKLPNVSQNSGEPGSLKKHGEGEGEDRTASLHYPACKKIIII